MRLHLLNGSGESLGDERIHPPTPKFKDGVTALEFETIDMLVLRDGTAEWALVTLMGKPWNIFPMDPPFVVHAGDVATIMELVMLLEHHLSEDVVQRLYPQGLIERPDDPGMLRRAVKRLGMGS